MSAYASVVLPEPLGPMMAWTSPLRTVRSIPLRISWSGCAAGATWRSRMTRSWSLTLTRLLLEGGGGRRGRSVGQVYRVRLMGRYPIGPDSKGRQPCRIQTDPRGNQIGQRHRVEGAGDGVPHSNPHEVDGAVAAAFTGQMVGVVDDADHRRDRSLESPQNLAHDDLLGRASELVAAVGAAGASHELGVAQAYDELFQVRPRQILLLGDLGQAGRPGAVAPRQLSHQAHAVFALRGEGNGAGAVVGPSGQSGAPVGASGRASGVG